MQGDNLDRVKMDIEMQIMKAYFNENKHVCQKLC
jgi:hypothetical protein